MSKLSPIKPRSRLEFVDILRGFALFGVLAANLSSFSGYSSNVADYTDFLDKAVLIGIQFFVRAKFYTLFSFLFGWGMAVQMQRAAEKGQRFWPLFARRMGILLIFGLIHGMLIWSGDVLTLYAILGLALLLFRKRSERTLLTMTVIFLLLTIVLNLPGERMNAFREWYASITEFMRWGDLPQNILATGSYWEIVPKTTQDFWAAQSWFIYYLGGVFSMFLMGFYVGKRRILQHVDGHLPLLKRTLLVGLIVGVVFNGIYVWNTLHPEWVNASYNRFVGVGSRTIGAPALMLFYVSGLILLTRRNLWLERLRPLGNVGRMALSNYLLQSVLCVLIFYAFGLGLYGQTDPTFGFIVTVVIFAAQIRFSRWHLHKYHFGPMEWVWRTLTYGRRQAWKQHEAAVVLARENVSPVSRRFKPILGLGIAGVILALGAGLLFMRDGNGLASSNIPPLLAAQATATLTPSQPTSQPDEKNEPYVIATPHVQEVAYRPGPIAQAGDMTALARSFDAERALEQIVTLSGSPFDGRRAGSAGGLAAGDYLADQFAALGLRPAGDDSTFFQSFPISYTNLAEVPKFRVTLPGGEAGDDYVLYQDFAPLIRDFVGQGSGSGDVLWMNRCSHEDFGQLVAEGKIALCQLEGGREAFLQANRNAREHGVSGLLLVTDPAQRPPDMGDRFTHPWIPEPLPALRVYPRLVDDLFLGSGLTITESLLLDQPMSLATHVDLSVETVGTEVCPPVVAGGGCTGRNVLAVLPGRDPEFAGEVVILGAHYDHLGDAPSDGGGRTVWAGANDDASGTAVLLEIARTWREEGYVPRRTVLFAAWDAEELGLLGSSYYVEHPQYAPEDVVGLLQLDMVGAGGEFLNVDGSDALVSTLKRAGEDLGLTLEQIRLGRSDHVPFLQAGVPAAMLIWLDAKGNTPSHYHRPADTPDVIDLEKLELVGEIAATTVLNLAESEPAILALLTERAQAATEDDLAAFLETSTIGQASIDRSWFNDLQTRNPLTVTISSSNLQVSSDVATAETTISATYAISETQQTSSGNTLAQYVRVDDGWRWNGPHLAQISEDGVTVSYPPDVGGGLETLPAAVRGQYAQIAGALGVSANTPISLQLFPDEEDLRASTDLFMAEDGWVGPGVVRMVYTEGITKTAATCRSGSKSCPTDALTQLVLVNNGANQADDPWLWQGLPLVWQAQRDPIRVQSEQLPQLQQALIGDQPIPPTTAAWAATDYALRQVGWRGLLDWQQSDAWEQDWEQRLATVQAELDALLEQRTQAILAQNEAVFLDTAVPELAAAQRRWLSDLDAHPLNGFAQTAVPLALLEDEAVLAQVTMNYELSGRGPSTAETTILFTPGGEGYLWAGKRLHDLAGETAVVSYPDGYEETAEYLFEKASEWTPQLASLFGISPALPVQIELYDGADDNRVAIALPYSAANWTEPGQAIKLRTSANDGQLVTQLTRQLLYQADVSDEWLLRGVPIFVSAQFDGGAAQKGLAGQWSELKSAVSEDRLIELAGMVPALEMSEQDNLLAEIAAWDAVRYFVQAYGWGALTDLIRGQNEQFVQGEFQQEWADSVARGHIRPEWVEMMAGFDGDRAMASTGTLASEEMAGRLAGSCGAEIAADTIVEAFLSAGLEPAGDGNSYLQSVPITISNTITPIRLEITTGDGEYVNLVYREEFLPVHPVVGGDPVSGELFFAQKEAEYEGVDFEGGIVVRTAGLPIEDEVRQAMEHGAGALILTGFKREDVDLYGKTADTLLVAAEIPVLELTQDGTARLLSAVGLDQQKIKKLPPIEAVNGEALVHFAVSPEQRESTSNVLGVLPGSDPFLSREIVVVGAHYDFVGDDIGVRRYGGANEATGVAAMLEMARLWQEGGYEPKRSVLFAAWGGEELGNVGSQFYVANATRPLSDTIAFIGIEGIGGGRGIALGAKGEMERDGLLMNGLETAVRQLDGKVVMTSDVSQSDLASFADLRTPRILLSWRLAGNDNLSDNAAYVVKPESLRFAGQAAALLVMSLAQ